MSCESPTIRSIRAPPFRDSRTRSRSSLTTYILHAAEIAAKIAARGDRQPFGHVVACTSSRTALCVVGSSLHRPTPGLLLAARRKRVASTLYVYILKGRMVIYIYYPSRPRRNGTGTQPTAEPLQPSPQPGRPSLVSTPTATRPNCYAPARGPSPIYRAARTSQRRPGGR